MISLLERSGRLDRGGSGRLRNVLTVVILLLEDWSLGGGGGLREVSLYICIRTGILDWLKSLLP